MGIDAKLQIRRFVWLLKDLRRSLRGLGRAIRYARQPDYSVGIGLLEGGAWARRGQANAYRIRVVNDSPEPRDVELLLHGEQGRADPLETCERQRVPGNAATELFLVTDWTGAFEIASDPPSTDPIMFLATPSTGKSCQVTAMLSADGRRLDELNITQQLVE